MKPPAFIPWQPWSGARRTGFVAPLAATWIVWPRFTVAGILIKVVRFPTTDSGVKPSIVLCAWPLGYEPKLTIRRSSKNSRSL